MAGNKKQPISRSCIRSTIAKVVYRAFSRLQKPIPPLNRKQHLLNLQIVCWRKDGMRWQQMSKLVWAPTRIAHLISSSSSSSSSACITYAASKLVTHPSFIFLYLNTPGCHDAPIHIWIVSFELLNCSVWCTWSAFDFRECYLEPKIVHVQLNSSVAFQSSSNCLCLNGPPS